jgi:hypothetical protein
MVTVNLYTIDWKSWQSIAIALATRSIYTHSAIQVGSKIFEASGHTDSVGWVDAEKYAGRECKRIELDVSRETAAIILAKYEGKRYDYRAIRLWPFSIQSKNKIYCFELCWLFMKQAGLLDHDKPDKITAHSLLER